jgi:hypothetical protein
VTSASEPATIAGLSALASRTYEDLLRNASGLVQEDQVDPLAVRELADRAFAVVVAGPPRAVVPIPPEIAIGRATLSALHDWMGSAPDLSAAERDIHRLGSLAHSLGVRSTPDLSNDFAIATDEPTRAVYAEAINGARRSVRTMLSSRACATRCSTTRASSRSRGS